MKTEQLKQHIQYAAWASARLVESAAALSPEDLNRDCKTAGRSVLDTLVHVFAADRVWLARARGAPASFINPEDRHLSVLQNDWPAVYQGWQDLLSAKDDSSVLRLTSYKDLKGNPYQTPLWQIVLHVVNHGTHHRGQVAGFLRSMGHTPPPLDLVFYYRQIAQN
ncbi:MAG: DinB family protein [Acidobacteriia bacterium]|nr:DinB family protein [Terriglobia bacterium]